MIGISVIIPVYNSEKYIEETLSKIAEWTYPNLEIIFVDDGSKDHTFDLIKNSKINNFRLEYQENGGVSKARNYGFQLAKMDYVFFMDSDDYVEDSYFYEMDSIVKGNDEIDLVINKFVFVFENKEEKVLQDFNEFSGIKDSLSSLKLLFMNKIGPVGRNVIFSRAYLLANFGNKPFPEGRTKEDGASVYKFIGFSKQIFFYDKACYYYNQRDESMVHSYKAEDMNNIIKNSIEQLDFIKKYNSYKLYVLCINFIYHNIFQEYRKQILLKITAEELKMNRKKIDLFVKKYIKLRLLNSKNFFKQFLFKTNLFELTLKANLRIKKGRNS
ncbi:glycosyltransferase family 2 protein [Enterococcus gallinarum]|uniref:glycosyltransferase family 2 protein n=1 Tax=Enterococcus gallinarum TaxID=1353 RepID=UPI001C60F094|nr:glycosyltransferase family A protein [Enterococcus gallinarum]MBW5471948.1 glycosyltransferase [Enterococcus gallinarum]MDT2695644.1 glycosyltransferase family A protein [Enterococcus gallinarum]UJA24462.1 glycosyltransferase family 2 protein [Enterococcus gallinarum]